MSSFCLQNLGQGLPVLGLTAHVPLLVIDDHSLGSRLADPVARIRLDRFYN